MAKLIILAPTRWRQPLIDRKKDFQWFNTQREVARNCDLQDGTRRTLRVTFDNDEVLSQTEFAITSGLEIRFDDESQEAARLNRRRSKRSYFDVEVLDADISTLSTISNDIDHEAIEGERKLVTHVTRERDPGLAKRKKDMAFSQLGHLNCEVCDFSFKDKYGELGTNFIECHHINPVALRENAESTALDDLMLVCPNCHRMIHRYISKTRRDKSFEVIGKLAAGSLRKVLFLE